jgi:2-C-methyl-D-erythritol 4-phosphate cytidylyltransferase
MSERFWAVVPAAGAGKRMASQIPKQYLPLAGRRVIEHTLARLLSHRAIEAAVVALSPADEWWPQTDYAGHARVITVDGGSERCHSVLNALEALQQRADGSDWVLVHDAARPCLHPGDLDSLINGLSDDPVGGLLGVPVHDTMKRVDSQGEVVKTVPRAGLWHAYTPQMFRLQTLHGALTGALAKGELVTDDASAMELAGYRPRLVQGRPDNIKITRPEDLPLAEFYLSRQLLT